MKYALVDNGIIKVGPRDYHPAFFENYLKSQGVEFSVPYEHNGIDPIVISPTISILAITQLDVPYCHPVTEQLAGPFWTVGETAITGTMEVVPVQLEPAQNKMKEIVAAARYKKENSLIEVSVQDNLVKVSAARGYDREIWHQMLTLMTDTSTTLFKFTEPTTQWINLTKSDVATVAAALAQHVQECFNWENAKVAEIEQADLAQLEVIFAEVVPVAP